MMYLSMLKVKIDLDCCYSLILRRLSTVFPTLSLSNVSISLALVIPSLSGSMSSSMMSHPVLIIVETFLTDSELVDLAAKGTQLVYIYLLFV